MFLTTALDSIAIFGYLFSGVGLLCMILIYFAAQKLLVNIIGDKNESFKN